MRRTVKTLFTASAAAALAACNNGPGLGMHPAQQMSKHVEIVELEPAANGAREFELRIPGDERYTLNDHAVALVSAMTNEHCDGNGFSLEMGGEGFPTGDAHPEPGQAFSMRVTCQLGRLPNHRTVETGISTFDAIPLPSGKEFKAASRLASGEDRKVDVVNQLLGGFVREAYTEDCGQGPMVIEHIETATEAGPLKIPGSPDGKKSGDFGPKTHAVLTFRCLVQDGNDDA